MVEILFLRVFYRSRNLIRIVVKPNNFAPNILSDLSSRSTDTAANIENCHIVLKVQFISQKVFMSGESLEKGFTNSEAAEMEGLSPTLFIEIGRKVVVTIPNSQPLAVRSPPFVEQRPFNDSMTHLLTKPMYSPFLCSRFSSPVTFGFSLFFQCRTYSSVTMRWATLSFFSIAKNEFCASTDFPCMALVKEMSRSASSVCL